MSTFLFLGGLFLGLIAAICAFVLTRRVRVHVVALITSISCAMLGAAAMMVIHTGRSIAIHSSFIFPFVGVRFTLNPFGAIFTLTTAVVAIASSIYWVGYRISGFSDRSSTGAFALFVLAMLLVPAAGNVITFYFAWELMALASLVLVLSEHAHREQTRSAGVWYGVMTHLGAAFILMAMLLLVSHGGGESFSSIRSHLHDMSPALKDFVFLLALIGFSSKAGIVPLHVWLPKAHPEAPSPASALMSGAMVNLGVFGILLVGDGFLGGGPSWWWLLVIALGVLSALFGSMHAAISSDLKRLLAYSTTDNMGLVLMAVGASGLFDATGNRLLGSVALVVSLVLVINHSIFKGSLFMSAGSIQVATHSRDLDQLGGLMRKMPSSALILLVGALSISALPPFNGFIGEWLLLQTFLHGLESRSTTVLIVVPMAVSALALSSGLTASAFVKVVGIGLLGRPRSEGARQAREVPVAMRLGAGLLGIGCLFLGVLPLMIVPSIAQALSSLSTSFDRLNLRADFTGGNFNLRPAQLNVSLSPVFVFAGLFIAVGVILGIRRILNRRIGLRYTDPWASGRELQTARMQYTATSFAEPLQRVFDDVLQPDRDLEVSHLAESAYFVESMTYRLRIGDSIEQNLYRPLIRCFTWWGKRIASFQNGSIHRYLAYGLVVLIVILAVMAR